MDNTQRKFADLILNNGIGKKLYLTDDRDGDKKIYFLDIEDKMEREILLDFFKTLQIDVLENSGENHNTNSLVDIVIINNNKMVVDWQLWHALMTNGIRRELSHNFREFYSMVHDDESLSNLLDKIIRKHTGISEITFYRSRLLYWNFSSGVIL